MIRGRESNHGQMVVRLSCCLLIPVNKPYMPYHQSLGTLPLEHLFSVR